MKYAERFPSFTFVCTDREVDISHEDSVRAFMEGQQIDVIINCAAYTAVDKAEEAREQAYQLNAEAPEILARQANAHHCRLLHVSTDYVFDGKAYRPYTEDVACNPQSVYGSSKLAGEQAVQAVAHDYIIIRTSWLYSEFGHNFMKTIDKYSHERDSLQVVADQIGTPTYASDLALAMLHIVQQAGSQALNALYHYGNQGVASWYDFACAIVKNNGSGCKVQACASDAYPQQAQRPYYSVLSKETIAADWQIEIPHWQDSLETIMREMRELRV